MIPPSPDASRVRLQHDPFVCLIDGINPCAACQIAEEERAIAEVHRRKERRRRHAAAKLAAWIEAGGEQVRAALISCLGADIARIAIAAAKEVR